MMIRKAGLAAAFTAAVFTPFLLADDREEAAVALYAIGQSGVTVLTALDIVEQSVTGIVYEYELDDKDDQLFHEFEVADFDAEKKYKVLVSVRDGSIADISDKKLKCGSLSCKDDDGQAARALAASGYSLRQALTQLELSPQELVEEVELEFERGVRYLKLEVIGPDGERDILIDIASGQIIPTLTHGS
jgi:uncharacterized membrane protein YkoI